MTELSLAARRLIVQLRHVDAPTVQERSRADAAVRSMLEARGLQGLPHLAPPLRLQRAANAATAPRGISIKPLWVVGVALVATLGLYGREALRSPRQAAAPGASESALSAAAVSGVTVTEAASVIAPSASPALAVQDAPSARRQGKPAEGSLAEELRFLSSVDAEIRAGSYEPALLRLQQHRRGVLLQEERAAMRVLALCGLERDSLALRERAKFLAAHPGSVLAARVRGACSGVAGP